MNLLGIVQTLFDTLTTSVIQTSSLLFWGSKNASTSNSPNLSATYQWLLAPTLQETNISYLESWWLPASFMTSTQHLMKESDSFHYKRSQRFEGSLYYQPIHYVTMKRVMPCLNYPWHFSINFDPPLKIWGPIKTSQTPTNSANFKKRANCAAEKNSRSFGNWAFFMASAVWITPALTPPS